MAKIEASTLGRAYFYVIYGYQFIRHMIACALNKCATCGSRLVEGETQISCPRCDREVKTTVKDLTS